MTMLSAQPVTLTGEQHQYFWSLAKRLREIGFKAFADQIEATLIAAQDSAAPVSASSGEAA